MDDPRYELLYSKIQPYKPESFLQLCPVQGHLLRKVGNRLGIKTRGLEPSLSNYLTRTSKDIIHWDLKNTPWPVKAGEFDTIFTDGILDLVPDPLLPALFDEIHRVSQRGIHVSDVPGRLIGLGPKHTLIATADTYGQGEIFYNTGVLKLNLGSGRNMFRDGWSNVDVQRLEGYAEQMFFRFAIHDIRNRLPALDNTVTAIVMSHVLECLEVHEYHDVLLDCWRALTVGGFVRISVIDDDKITDDWKFLEEPLMDRKLRFHPPALVQILEKIGFCHVKLSKFQESECRTILAEAYDTLPDISHYIEARKLVL